ncbi:flagellar motor protein MotD [Ketobacter sp. MCCC 1A13808]|uniref:flagellar motor protein MotD n=1 Tax=Ketobacter sp. MCCC 1A13808 TaxID=2602738 RepID=UPI000F2C52A0|nr:flagellar motor protein MotD [Ketobacter sp. MCCC 1A13808]MVF10893.1 flagellar motor protein MotD [Ketobacter sp. MCCC 1A13808]RLP56286.1 MAG: flagellar motor protein MotD [Ketobacter sp.]
MIRKREPEEPENHERWVISYADFITLLFAFFVVMYSISSVNEGKYKVLSDSLVAVFNAQPKTYDPTSVGDKDLQQSNDSLIKLPIPGEYPSNDDFKYGIEGIFDDVESKSFRQGKLRDNEVARLSKISDQLATSLQQQIANNDVEIRSNDEWIEVNIRASVLYPSGSASLSAEAETVLEKIADILKGQKNPIHVEGYTDNVPIETAQYPSNWELSAARAASVVRLFSYMDVDPGRMAAVGYGEFHPIASNDTADGRSKNRRIALVISKNESVKATPDKGAAPADYKMGASEEKPAASGLQNRQRKEAEVPLRIIRLKDGGLLFSSQNPTAE